MGFPVASIQPPGISVSTLSSGSYGLSRSGEVHPHQSVRAGRPCEQCEHVHVCAVHRQPLAPPVCVWAIPAPPRVVQPGEGDRGQSGWNRREREPEVLIQTHRGGRGGHEVTRHLHHTQTPAPSLAAAVATATRGAQSIPGYCQPLLLPRRCWGLGCPRGREKCRGCPCHGDAPGLQAAPTGGPPAPPGAAMFQYGVTVAPGNGVVSMQGHCWEHGAATVRAHWPSPLPP